MPPKSRDELIAQTRSDAISFIEDLDHLKQVSEKAKTNPVDLRHASVILRRWLVEGLLKRVASPRIGRVEIKAIDNNPVYRAARGGNVHSFVSGGASVHGIYLSSGMACRGQNLVDLKGYHPDTTIDLRLDSFRKQQVIYTSGKWVTRDQIIKFVANIDRGVHSGQVKDNCEKLLSDFRQQVSVSLVEDENGKEITQIGWMTGEPALQSNPKDYDPSNINGTLLEILATFALMISSPDIEKLADTIRSELQAT